jgi:hypothetical protein
MKYLAFFGLIATINAVPVVGGITKNMICKDFADYLDGTGYMRKIDCDSDAADCSLVKQLLDGEFVATEWSEVDSKCSDAFDTDAGDFKCILASHYDGTGSCSAMSASSTVELTDALKATTIWAANSA